MKMMRGFALVLGVVALCLGLLASSASARPPEKIAYPPGTGEVWFEPPDLCPTITVVIYMEIEEVDTIFYDQEGNVVMYIAHMREKDTFRNPVTNKTLEGAPYTFIIRGFLDENGEAVYSVNGILEKVRLPDGKLWIGAGRTIPWYGFGLVTDKGTPASIDDLCAALAQ